MPSVANENPRTGEAGSLASGCLSTDLVCESEDLELVSCGGLGLHGGRTQ